MITRVIHSLLLLGVFAGCQPPAAAVAFCSAEPTSVDSVQDHAIAVLTFDGLVVYDAQGRHSVPGSAGVGSFSWSSDEQGFYVTRGASLEYLPSDGGAVTELRGEWRQVRFPAVSPDGQTLAVTANLTDDIATGWQVWLLGVDGSTPTPLVDGYHPAWSADGSRIFFERHEPSVALASIDLETGMVSPFLGAEHRDIGMSISRRGSFAAFARGHERRMMLYDFARDSLLTLSAGPGFSQYPSFSSDERMVLFHQQIESDEAVTLQIVVCELATGRTVVLVSDGALEGAFGPA